MAIVLTSLNINECRKQLTIAALSGSGTLTGAAQQLGITYNTLRKYIKDYDMQGFLVDKSSFRQKNKKAAA